MKKQKDINLLHAAGPLELVAMDLLGPVPKKYHGNQHVLLMSDRFTNLSRSISLRTINFSVAANAFLDNWNLVYGARRFALTDNSLKFAAKFFDALCALLGVRQYFNTAYHSLTNVQTEQINCTLVQRLQHLIEEYQSDWDGYFQPLTLSYNAQVDRSTETSLFDRGLARPQNGLVLARDALQNMGSNREDLRIGVQYKRAKIRKLRDIIAWNFVYVDRPPRLLIIVERREHEQDTTNARPASLKLLPKT